MAQMLSGESYVVGDKEYFRLGCCDCGLVHLIGYRIEPKKRIRVTLFRDDWETNQGRKRKRNRKRR